MTGFISLAAEGVMALLLTATIAYCVILDRRLKQLRADEQIMRRTVTELAGATDNAERAIGVLKQAVAQADASLGSRLETAERFAADLSVNLRAGEDIIDRVRQIVETARRAAAAEPIARPFVQPLTHPLANPLGPAPGADAAQSGRPAASRLAAAAVMAERLVERARARQRGAAA